MLSHKGVVSPAPTGIITLGPLVAVELAPHPSVPSAGIVSPIPVKMMVDTGAQRTVIEKRLASQLGVAPIRFQQMVGVSQQPELCPVYVVSVTLRVGDNLQHAEVTFVAEVIGMSSPPTPQEHVGLLGRDFLRHFRFTYDGPRGEFELVPEKQGTPVNAAGLHAAKVVHDHGKKKAKRKEARKARKRNRR